MVNILIAEDDFFVRKEIKRVLSQTDYNLCGEAQDGEKAVELACQLQPDVILMDIKMPKMTGIEAARIIQDKCPTPIVFLTAHESADIVEEATNAGASSYLTKPPNVNKISQAITVAMARHQDLIELRKLNKELKEKTEQLQNALNEIRQLREILPICCKCKKIRSEEGYWDQVEAYFQRHTDLSFSHSICPDCTNELYGDQQWFKGSDSEQSS